MLEQIAREMLQKEYDSLDRQGALLSVPKLRACQDLFRQRFGPVALGAVDGEALLELMHGHGNQAALVYWLEFKDDEEFPARFGSISGGSALKFGLYRRKETGEWMTGASKKQQKITIAEAVATARRHREQLAAGCAVLDSYTNKSNVDYKTLQAELTTAASDVADTSWGHKYFSLLYPALLDDFHNADYQRFHLIRTLVAPPAEEGRYVCAGLFVDMCNELGWPMNHLTGCMNRLHGSPYRYWRIGTTQGEAGKSEWEQMRAGNYVSVGWKDMGDLSGITLSALSKEDLRKLYNETYGAEDPRAAGRSIQQLFNFVASIEHKDVVLACAGETVHGIGRVVGDYQYDGSLDFPHKRPVEWLSLDKWRMADPEGLRTTVHQLRKNPANLVEAERRCMATGARQAATTLPELLLSPLSGRLGHIEGILDRKSQVILYGPPGTGKTFWAEKAVRVLASRRNFGKDPDDLGATDKQWIDPSSAETFVAMCCFHPSYGYEDFIEGYRPFEVDGKVAFRLRDGIFKALCRRATQKPQASFYLLIDEINRGDIPRIFGELITLIEKGKRGTVLTLPLSGEPFSVPQNVWIIGTMNTADRSIALLDTALRRRFGFIELMPDYELLRGAVVAGVPIAEWLRSLNQRIRENVGRDARNIQVGHAYFMERGKVVQNVSQLQRIVRDDVIPLLQEYCYEDFTVLEKLLGAGFVDTESMTIKSGACDSENHDDFVAALLKPDTSIQATADAVEADEARPAEPGPDEADA